MGGGEFARPYGRLKANSAHVISKLRFAALNIAIHLMSKASYSAFRYKSVTSLKLGVISYSI